MHVRPDTRGINDGVLSNYNIVPNLQRVECTAGGRERGRMAHSKESVLLFPW